MDRVTTGVVATLVVGVVLGFVHALQPSAPTTVATAPVLPAGKVPPTVIEVVSTAVTSRPGTASSPKAPVGRLSTDRDLFATYRELNRSTLGGDLYVANAILFTCYLTSRAASDMRPVAAGLTQRGRNEPPTPVQIEAARDLLSRCSGFDDMTALSLQQARADLRARLDRADDPVGWGEAVLRHRRPVSDELLRSIVASQDPVAIGDVSSALFDRRRRAADRPLGGDDDAVLQASVERSVVMTLVSCDLGGDCAADGFQMKQACAFNVHVCGMDLRTRLFEELSDDDRRRLSARAAMLVQAIEENDVTVWGLQATQATGSNRTTRDTPVGGRSERATQ